MRSNKLLLLGGVVVATELVWQLYKKFHDLWTKSTNTCTIWKADVDEPKQNISEVMFFTRDSRLCRAHIACDEACPKDNCPVRYLRKLEHYINEAEQNLDVCMYTFSCQLLSMAIVNAHKRGVLVRIILDWDMARNNPSFIALFFKNRIELRMQQLDVLMHHKFVIVDSDIVITGSTNWTMSAFFGNFDHIVVTNQRSLVKPFVDEFNTLWNILQTPICSELQEASK